MNKQFLLVFICFLLASCSIKKEINKNDTFKPTTAKLLIMTAEILRNSLLRKSDEKVYEWNFNPKKVGCIINK